AADALTGGGRVSVIGDHYGALTLGAIARHGVGFVRVHQDLLTSEQALDANAALTGLSDRYQHHALGPELLDGATVVLVQSPKSLDGLREVAEAIARHADPRVAVYVGGRVKHMTRAMNDVLGDSFESVRASLARQKSRVLIADTPRRRLSPPTFPLREFHDDLGLWVGAHGEAFAGTKVDIGTRYLLSFLGQMGKRASQAVDLGCGTGILAAALARSRPELSVIATDQSSTAVASAAETMRANGLADRVEIRRDNAMAGWPDGSTDLVMLNPPFHLGTTVDTSAAEALFEAAGRVLRPGGELWTVFNSHLTYQRPHGPLARSIGPTRVVGRNPKFTVTVSIRRG
ncbi:MAG: rRNA (guanine1207-N2)-methyltransferase, partial [Pseudonocardiales bacterium]|nr:rRNA (guanine1207-N2)-methyltransferase [Pseudonocardiales bacterium]